VKGDDQEGVHWSSPSEIVKGDDQVFTGAVQVNTDDGRRKRKSGDEHCIYLRMLSTFVYLPFAYTPFAYNHHYHLDCSNDRW
jgi:hypothetical protein